MSFNKPIIPWHGLSAAVLQICIFRFTQRDIKWSLSYSPPLSTKNLLGQPKVDIHISKIFLIIFAFHLVETTQEALKHVKWSIKCRNHILDDEDHSLRCKVTV